jgi:hypothetical protein
MCDKGNAAPSGLVDDYFWLDQRLPKWRALIDQQEQTLTGAATRLILRQTGG